MQYRNRTIEFIPPVALATMIDEYAIFGPKLGDRLPSFFGVSLSEHLVEIAFDESLYGVRHRSLLHRRFQSPRPRRLKRRARSRREYLAAIRRRRQRSNCVLGC